MMWQKIDNGFVMEQWDDSTRQYTDFQINPAQVMSYAAKSVADGLPSTFYDARADANILTAGQATNRSALVDTTALAARLARLKAYDTDPEITAALARTNSTVIATADLNRLLKVMLRRDQRQSAAIALLVRLVDPSLLTDVSDTTDN